MTPPLTYTATVQPNGDATIVLGEGTHERGSGNGFLFTATNGITVWSHTYPCWCTRRSELYLQGRSHTSDHNPIPIPAADWQRVKQALDEYGAVQTNAETRQRVTRAEALEISQQTIETAERERSQANAEQTEESKMESKMYAISETPSSFYIYAHGKPSAAILDKAHGCTRAIAEKLCAELNARADAERKATEVRVDRVSEKIIVLYVGNRSGGSQCVTITHLPNDGITKAQADQLAAATAEALRGILAGQGDTNAKA